MLKSLFLIGRKFYVGRNFVPEYGILRDNAIRNLCSVISAHNCSKITYYLKLPWLRHCFELPGISCDVHRFSKIPGCKIGGHQQRILNDRLLPAKLLYFLQTLLRIGFEIRKNEIEGNYRMRKDVLVFEKPVSPFQRFGEYV